MLCCRRRFDDVFRQYDADGSGTLEPMELRRLLRDLLPRVTEGQLHYFQVGGWLRELGAGAGGQSGCFHRPTRASCNASRWPLAPLGGGCRGRCVGLTPA